MKRFPLLTSTRQSTEYSCGASALQAVLSYWGKDVEEQELMQRLHTSPETGTYVGDIARVAREFGFTAEVKEDLTLKDLHAALRKGIPVITCGQAWRSRENSDKSVQEDWEDDHYIVVLGMDNNYVYYQDPFAKRGNAFVSHRLFEESWHNVRGITKADRKKQIHLGVFISGGTPPRRHPLGAMHVTESDLAQFGLLQLVNIRFKGKIFPNEVLRQLKNILNRDLVRPVAYIVLVKDREGNIFVLEGGDLEEEEADEINTVISYLVGLRAGRPGLVGEGAAPDPSGISEKHLQKMAEDLPPEHSALLLVLEHVWTKKARDLFSSLGGSVVSHAVITQDMLIRLGAQLHEGPAAFRSEPRSPP
jgi:predicted double-glycine peptidase